MVPSGLVDAFLTHMVCCVSMIQSLECCYDVPTAERTGRSSKTMKGDPQRDSQIRSDEERRAESVHSLSECVQGSPIAIPAHRSVVAKGAMLPSPVF